MGTAYSALCVRFLSMNVNSLIRERQLTGHHLKLDRRSRPLASATPCDGFENIVPTAHVMETHHGNHEKRTAQVLPQVVADMSKKTKSMRLR